MGNTDLVLSFIFMGEKVELPGDSQKSVHIRTSWRVCVKIESAGLFPKSVGLGEGLRIYVSNKYLSGTNAAGPGTALQKPLTKTY